MILSKNALYCKNRRVTFLQQCINNEDFKNTGFYYAWSLVKGKYKVPILYALMEYKVKASKTITATYASNHITVTCGGDTLDITVKDDSANFVLSNSTYETKAKNYENKIEDEGENYHVMLAGSSSIEFWTSSKTVLGGVYSGSGSTSAVV